MAAEHPAGPKSSSTSGPSRPLAGLLALRSSLSVKMIGSVVLVASVVFIPYLLWTTHELREHLTAVQLERGIAIGRTMDAGVRTAAEWENHELLDASIEQMMWLDPEIISIDVTAPSGGRPTIVTSGDVTRIGQPADELSPIVKATGEIRHVFGSSDGERSLRVVTPVHIARTAVGTVVIELTMERVEAHIARDVLNRVLLFLLDLGLLGLLIHQILRVLVLRPVRGIERGVGWVAQGHLDRHVDVDGPDELGRLGHAFNEMIDDVARSREALTTASAKLAETAEALTRQNALRHTLHTTAVQLMNRRAVHEVLEEVVARAASLCSTEHGFVYLREAGSDEITMKVGLGIFESQIGFRKWLGEGIGGIVCATGETLVVQNHDRWPYRTNRQYHEGAFYSCIGVPLEIGEGIRGAIGIAFRDEDRVFQEDEIKIMEHFAELASLALDNAELHASALGELRERRAAEAELKEDRELLAHRVAERTAELRRSNEALESAMRSRDEFLAGMSHELRTPLTAILGLSQVLTEGGQGELDEQQRSFLGMIEDSGRHLLSLINDVLDIAKIEAGRLELSIEAVEVEPLCRDSLQLISQAAREKSHRVTLDVDPAVKFVLADELRLRQILINLLDNAVKFTPEGGAIDLRVHGDLDKQSVYFEIRDNGVGIEPDQLSKLFQPFTQLDVSLAKRHAGTGLGLALVSRFTELHQGSVSVESQPGRGSRFTVSLPWTLAPGSPVVEGGSPSEREFDATPAPRVGENGTIKLLIVEDNKATITALREYLSLCGYATVVARTGHTGLIAVEEERPDLVVMDIQMPEMDGLQAIRLLRANPTLAHIPIIALTALAMPGDRERCLEAGADAYLRKPIRMDLLDETIRKLLARRA